MKWMLCVCLVSLCLCGLSEAADHTTDTPMVVKKAVTDDKAVIIDVREQKEWDAGHLADAKLLPLSKLKAGMDKAELKKLIPEGKIVYLHCKSGGRCLQAADLLKKQGFEVRALKEGFTDLVKEGFTEAKK